MSILSTFAGFVQSTLFGGTWDDLAFELRVLKKEVAGLHTRIDRELGEVRDRLDRLEGKPGKGRGRGRLSVLSGADVADVVPEAEAAGPAVEAIAPQEAVSSQAGLETAGEPAFARSLTIAEVLALHPEASEVLARHHLPGCRHCAVSDSEPLEDGLLNHGVDVETVLAELNRLVWN